MATAAPLRMQSHNRLGVVRIHAHCVGQRQHAQLESLQPRTTKAEAINDLWEALSPSRSGLPLVPTLHVPQESWALVSQLNRKLSRALIMRIRMSAASMLPGFPRLSSVRMSRQPPSWSEWWRHVAPTPHRRRPLAGSRPRSHQQQLERTTFSARPSGCNGGSSGTARTRHSLEL